VQAQILPLLMEQYHGCSIMLIRYATDRRRALNMAVFTHLDFKRNVDTAPSAFVKISFLSVGLLQLFGRSVDRDQGPRNKDIINGCSANWSMIVDLESA
jgi:hypothetical protein